MLNTERIFIRSIAFLTLFSLLCCSTLFGESLDDSELYFSGPVSASNFRWTREVMAAAKGYTLNRIEMTHSAKRSMAPEGPEGSGDARLPSRSLLDNPQLGPLQFVPITEGYAYPFPFTRYQNFNDYRAWPYSTIVKIYFREDNETFVCSGSVWPNHAVITAGHCIFNPDTGRFHTDFKIVPFAKSDEEPVGSFHATELVVPGKWKDEYSAFDMGLILTNTRDGDRISDLTGSLGAVWNVKRKQSWTMVGYPVNPPFNGKFQHICHASYADSDIQHRPPTVAIGCDLSGGISGGPLIIRFSGTKGSDLNLVNGVVSYRPRIQPEAIYFAYFGNAARKLWNIANERR